MEASEVGLVRISVDPLFVDIWVRVLMVVYETMCTWQCALVDGR
jgi:hypothetical protein